jgi:hypothetical protein
MRSILHSLIALVVQMYIFSRQILNLKVHFFENGRSMPLQVVGQNQKFTNTFRRFIEMFLLFQTSSMVRASIICLVS